MQSPWARQWAEREGRKPVVRLAVVRNRTDGYIETLYLTKQIEAVLVRSGVVEVVASLAEVETIRAERIDQAEHASDETAKSELEELGSDFLLTGSIVGSKADDPGYLVTLELVEVQTGRKAWVGQHRHPETQGRSGPMEVN